MFGAIIIMTILAVVAVAGVALWLDASALMREERAAH